MRPELLIGDGMQDRSEKVHGRKKHKRRPPHSCGGQRVKKVVIPSQCAHSSALRAGFRRLRYATVSGRSGLGDPPVKRNIFD